MKTFPILCEQCRVQLGDATFDDSWSDEHCRERTERGYLCETCANTPAADTDKEGADAVPS